MATAALEHCLATYLATNDAVSHHLSHLVSLLSSNRTLERVELDEGLHGPLLHRWQLRLTALVAPANPPQVRAAGFHLAHLSFQASTSLLLDAAKPILAQAHAVVTNPKADPQLFLAALELARLVVAKSTWHPEWARDNVGPQQVQKLVGSLVQAATVEFSDVRSRFPRRPCELNSPPVPPPTGQAPLRRRHRLAPPALPDRAPSSRPEPAQPCHRAHRRAVWQPRRHRQRRGPLQLAVPPRAKGQGGPARGVEDGCRGARGQH